MAIMDILAKLNELVDESDPDIDLPNAMHAFQTAEGIRKHHPDKPWLQVITFAQPCKINNTVGWL